MELQVLVCVVSCLYNYHTPMADYSDIKNSFFNIHTTEVLDLSKLLF